MAYSSFCLIYPISNSILPNISNLLLIIRLIRRRTGFELIQLSKNEVYISFQVNLSYIQGICILYVVKCLKNRLKHVYFSIFLSMNNSVMGLWLPFIGETNPMLHKIKRDALSDYMASRRQALNSLLRF